MAIKERNKGEDNELEDTRTHVMTDNTLGMYFKNIIKVDLLTEEEEVELAKLIEQGDEDAFNRLVEANLRLVVTVAKRFRGQGMDYIDLIQEGNLGLIRAVEKFDYSKGYRFSTYAMWWIKNSLYAALGDKSRLVRIPRNNVSKMLKVKRVRQELWVELDREPTEGEIGLKMEMGPEEVREVLEYEKEILALDKPIGTSETATLADVIEGSVTGDPYQKAAETDIQDRVGDMLADLTKQEEIVLRLRFGIGDDKNRTLQEVGDILGVTRERIRQVEIKALRKLRHPKYRKMIKELVKY